MGQGGIPLSVCDKLSLHPRLECQIIAAGDWSFGLYTVSYSGNLSICVTSSQEKLFLHLAEKLNQAWLMLHQCIANKPHKLKIACVGFLRSLLPCQTQVKVHFLLPGESLSDLKTLICNMHPTAGTPVFCMGLG